MRKKSNSGVPKPHLAAEASAARDAHLLLSEAQWQAGSRELRLTGRELQIVRYVFESRKERAIAAQLGTSLHTVRNQIYRLYRKLGVHSRVALVTRVVAQCSAQPGEAATSD
jgi:DNA-binding CsgD family transcriptional regulator